MECDKLIMYNDRKRSECVWKEVVVNDTSRTGGWVEHDKLTYHRNRSECPWDGLVDEWNMADRAVRDVWNMTSECITGSARSVRGKG